MITDLASLIQPMAEAEFIARFVRKEFTFLSGPRDEISSLLSLTEINRLLDSEAIGPPRVRLRRDEMAFPTSFYSDPELGTLYPATIQDALRKGASLVIDDIGPLVPRLHRLERALERRFKERVLINAYLSFNKGGAFAAHYDNHDVLVVQVHGRKRWQLLGAVEASAVSVKPPPKGARGPTEVSWERDIEPGDLLFIPRGGWHRAAVQGDVSIHLTITLVSRTGLDYAKWLVDQLGADDLLARDLPQLAGNAALDAHDTTVKARISEIFARLSAQAFLADKDGQCRTVTRFNLGEAWAPAESDILLSTLRRPLRANAGEGAAHVEVHAGGQAHVLAPPLYAALAEIDSRDEGIGYGALKDKLADKWAADAVQAAIARLAEKGLITVRPHDWDS